MPDQITKKHSTRIFLLLHLSALLMSLSIVFLSTHIRLGEAGLGCEPWPQCYAQLSFADGVKGLAIPDSEFKLFRSMHRSIASLLGLNILVIAGLALWMKKHLSPALPLMMLIVVIFLSILGIATPTRSLPVVTMGNILGGIALAGLIWAQLLHLYNGKVGKKLLRPDLFFAVLILIASGAWASANYTGGACPELLSCIHTANLWQSLPGSINPFMKLSLDEQDHLLLNTSSSIIQFSHRLFAVMWIVLVIHFFRKINRHYPQLKKPMHAVLILSLLEFILGITNVITGMPLWSNTLHNLLAAGLLFAVIALLNSSGISGSDQGLIKLKSQHPL